MKSVKRSEVKESVEHYVICPECGEETSMVSEDNNIVQCDTCFMNFKIENH